MNTETEVILDAPSDELVEQLIKVTDMETGIDDLMEMVEATLCDEDEIRPEFIAAVARTREQAAAQSRKLIRRELRRRIAGVPASSLQAIVDFFNGPVGTLWIAIIDDIEPRIHEGAQEIAQNMADEVSEVHERLETRRKGQS